MERSELVYVELPRELIARLRQSAVNPAASDSELVEGALSEALDDGLSTWTDAEIRAAVQESLEDPRPSLSMEEVFGPLREKYGLRANRA